MKVAVIGAGAAGLFCAHRLQQRGVDFTLFESAPTLGGHACTRIVDHEGESIAVDNGFVVYNEANYPHFSRALRELGVETQETSMSFSVRCDRTRLEYGGESLAGLFAQRRNALSPRFWRLLRDIRRFGPIALEASRSAPDDLTLGDFLDGSGFSSGFADRYLVPMASAIWSAPEEGIRRFPLKQFVAFFHNHGMLSPWKAPRWRTVVGGSREYVRRLAAPFTDRVRTSAPVASVRRRGIDVEVRLSSGEALVFDEVVLALHADQSLRVLEDASAGERRLLASVPYEPNDCVLHTDVSLLPRRRAAWSSWNYHIADEPSPRVAVTYNMSILQRLPTKTPLLVTLNQTDRIDPSRVIDRFMYDHPQYHTGSFAEQRRWTEVSGADRVHFCGAWCGYGFHEDAVRSGLRAADAVLSRALEPAA